LPFKLNFKENWISVLPMYPDFIFPNNIGLFWKIKKYHFFKQINKTKK